MIGGCPPYHLPPHPSFCIISLASMESIIECRLAHDRRSRLVFRKRISRITRCETYHGCGSAACLASADNMVLFCLQLSNSRVGICTETTLRQ